MSELKAKGITKKYGTKEVLHGIDLTLEKGRIYGLIGRNGAGKTSLLSILTSQNPATEGSVTFDEMQVWENPEALKHLCFSRELNQLQGGNANAMKVKEYLWAAATFFPYWDKEMAQKLVAGLDVVAREKFYEILVEEFMETGRTFVVSTHIIEEASDIFEEVILLDQGRILLKENTQNLLERAFHVSGHEEEVARAVEGLTVHHEERLGRSRGVTVLLEQGQRIGTEHDVSVQRVSLQKLFVALCGEE